nr:MAG TPA: hypothetical protein [Caudoviricetes sp.]
MRNIDFYIDNIAKLLSEADCTKECDCERCECDCVCSELTRSKEQVKNWLLEEHKEKIKLKQWEYDMLAVVKNSITSNLILESNIYFKELKEKGYFKNVDLNMTAEEVLTNCEIID